MMMKGYICEKKVLVMIERHDKELKKTQEDKKETQFFWEKGGNHKN